MNPILLELGPIKIYWYSITMLIGILIGGTLVVKEAKKFKISENFIYNLFFYIIPIALLGARLYYVIFNWYYYSNNLTSIFKVWEGGLAIHGGIIAGLLFIIYYTRKHKINTLKILDFIVVGLIIGQAIGRWGNFFNGEAHGPITTLEHLQSLNIPKFIIDGMYIGGNYYIPTFLYESLWCILGFIILLIIRRTNIKQGIPSSFYLIWYGIGRFMIEGMRTDSLMLGSLKMAQVVSIIMILIGIIMFMYFNFSKFNKLYKEVDDYE